MAGRESLREDAHSDCGCESTQGGLCNKHAEEVNGSPSLYSSRRENYGMEKKT